MMPFLSTLKPKPVVVVEVVLLDPDSFVNFGGFVLPILSRRARFFRVNRTRLKDLSLLSLSICRVGVIGGARSSCE